MAGYWESLADILIMYEQEEGLFHILKNNTNFSFPVHVKKDASETLPKEMYVVSGRVFVNSYFEIKDKKEGGITMYKVVMSREGAEKLLMHGFLKEFHGQYIVTIVDKTHPGID
jgi:hypothetical protein